MRYRGIESNHAHIALDSADAENPLSTPNRQVGRKGGGDGANDDSVEQLGNYETEQLINAIAKIADLLRKCWGVAGAGIISSNLARTKDGKTVVFNPTIPGKQVYALFGFIGINDFSKQLRALEGDVMILINDVARVVHDEVYRWALGDSGQCNKNLGSAFLMVFRIGDFSEVHDRKKRATDVVFNSQMRNAKAKQTARSNKRRNSSRHFDLGSGGTLQLASLPGIQAFADRALLGCLKSFAGLHRDQNLQNWQKDFRLGAGVGNFTINAIYGFDAGCKYKNFMREWECECVRVSRLSNHVYACEYPHILGNRFSAVSCFVQGLWKVPWAVNTRLTPRTFLLTSIWPAAW